MEQAVAAEEIKIMKTTIGLRTELIREDHIFMAERNYYYYVNVAYAHHTSKLLELISRLMEKKLMEEKCIRKNNMDVLCFQLSDNGKKLLEEIFDCQIVFE
jgi:hypothetical protein